MSTTPESEFTGIIQRSYTVGEMIDIHKAAQKLDEELDEEVKPKRPFKGRDYLRGLFDNPFYGYEM